MGLGAVVCGAFGTLKNLDAKGAKVANVSPRRLWSSEMIDGELEN
jgi:hypothetical protein